MGGNGFVAKLFQLAFGMNGRGLILFQEKYAFGFLLCNDKIFTVTI